MITKNIDCSDRRTICKGSRKETSIFSIFPKSHVEQNMPMPKFIIILRNWKKGKKDCKKKRAKLNFLILESESSLALMVKVEGKVSKKLALSVNFFATEQRTNMWTDVKQMMDRNSSAAWPAHISRTCAR